MNKKTPYNLFRLLAITVMVFLTNTLFGIPDKYQKDKEFMVGSFSPDEQRLYHLLSAQRYDSAIHICAHKKYPFNEDLIALAEAYEALGLKDSAYYYVNRKIDKDINEGLNPYATVTNYILTPHLCGDQEIALLIERRYATFYSKEGYKEWEAGLKILKLAYLDQKIRYKYAVDQSNCCDEECLEEVSAAWRSADSEIREELLNLWAEKGGYLSERLAGPWADLQLIITLHMADTLLRQKTVLPVLKKAYEAGDLSATGYIDQVVRTEFYRRGGVYDEYLENYADSLCKVYNCGITRQTLPQILKH